MKEKQTHTPGPWFTGEPFRILKGETPMHLIGIGNGAEHVGYVSITGCVPVEQANANAALIASAPDLLRQRDELVAALAGCVEIMTRAFPNGLPIQQGTLCEEQDWDTSLRQARTALAKSQGEEV